MQAPSQQSSTLYDPSSATFRSIIKSLQVIIKYQQNQQRKQKCIEVLQKLKNNAANANLVKQLDNDNQRKLLQVRTMLKIYRNAFQRITDTREQYRQFKMPTDHITQHLLNIQEKIDPRQYKTSYMRALTLKKKDFNWTKEFIHDWVKSVDDEKKIEEEKFKLKQAQRGAKVNKGQSLPEGQTASEAQASRYEISRESERSVQRLPGEKPQKKVKKDEAQKSQKQKKGAKSKKQADDSQSEENQAKQVAKKKYEKQQKQKNQQRYQKPREPKNRVKAFIQYLSSRRQFSHISSNPTKLKQMAQFLVFNLQKFMKHHLSNLIEIAKLRNRKHQTLMSSGNEFTYFSREGYNSIKPLTHLQVSQQPARMLKINYKSKFQLYSMLRSRQQALQQSLLKLYITKKDQQTSKGDKKLWEYLLRPNQVIERTDNYVEMEETRTDRLSIEIAHIRYLFQSHKFIRESWLMMYCYNS